MGLAVGLTRKQNRLYADLSNAYLKIKNFRLENSMINVEVSLYFDKTARDSLATVSQGPGHPTPGMNDGPLIQNFNYNVHEDDLPEIEAGIVAVGVSDMMKACLYRWLKENKFEGAENVLEN